MMRVFNYAVDIDRNCISSENQGGDGEWEQYDVSHYSNNFVSIEKVKEGQHYDFKSPYRFSSGEIGYVVWIEYSTGSTFGRSHRGCTEAVGLFKDKADAEFLAKRIQEHGDGPLNVITPDKQKFNWGFPSWTGYFENLDEVHVEEVEFDE